jgi:hypothetical protein
MIIEHCGDCEHHSASLWHDEDRYKSQADACLKAVAEVFTYLNMYIYVYISILIGMHIDMHIDMHTDMHI